MKLKEGWFKCNFTFDVNLTLEPVDETWRQIVKDNVANLTQGKPIWVRVQNNNPTRTQAQNQFYWGIYLPTIAKEWGGDKDSLHNYFKELFVPSEIDILPNGRKLKRYKTTTDMTTKEFSEYIRNIEVETGILAPMTLNEIASYGG